MPRHFRSVHLDSDNVAALRQAHTSRTPWLGERATPDEGEMHIAAAAAAGGEAAAEAAAPVPAKAEHSNDETAARYYLDRLFAGSEDADVNALTAPDRPAVVPDMRVSAVRRSPAQRTGKPREGAAARAELERPASTLVSFTQTSGNVPIFGSRATITLDGERGLLGARAEVASPPTKPPLATISPAAALERIAQAAGTSVEALGPQPAPRVEYFQEDDDAGTWHLVFHFSRVPAVPQRVRAANAGHEQHGHGLGPSPREAELQYDYLVDANEGTIVYDYSSNPTVASPVKCGGTDEGGKARDFFAIPEGASFLMYDPLRSIRTYDMEYSDIREAFPGKAIVSAAARPWAGAGAVSAHVHAMHVQQFYFDVLGRNSIDDQGMELVSVVNCTYQSNGGREWKNAVWYNQRMWYGQALDTPSGPLRSYARFLDVIGHELTHGVTEYTAKLVYRDLSGALNESFSDIFGVIINNWFNAGADSDVSTWSWKIGDGLGANGKPLRDMENPAALGYPDHMSKYVPITYDEGGVHIYSNIHNRAAYLLLTAGAAGARPVSGRDVAVLYYMTLQRLGSMADFSDARRVLIDCATVHFGDPTERAAAIAAITNAYATVGIT